MQAIKAYYEDGKIITIQAVKIPKSSLAIITILDFPINEVKSKESRREWLNRLEAAIDLSMDEDLHD